MWGTACDNVDERGLATAPRPGSNAGDGAPCRCEYGVPPTGGPKPRPEPKRAWARGGGGNCLRLFDRVEPRNPPTLPAPPHCCWVIRALARFWHCVTGARGKGAGG